MNVTTVKPEGFTHFLGKRPARYDRRDIRYADIRPKSLALPNVPASFGHGMDFGARGWLMLGNGPDDTVYPGFVGCGDCAWAEPAHDEMQGAHEAGRAIPKFSGKTVVDQYAQYSGYDPKSGNNDNGSDMREVLKWRQGKGLKDDDGNVYKIGPYIALEPGNFDQLREAVLLFETVSVGIQFPNSAMDQFNAGQDWSVVNGAVIEGGHAIPIVGRPWPGYWTCITWGQRQVMTWTFLAKYAEELYVYIDPERYSKVTGKTYEGYKDADLERYLTEVAKLLPDS